jgi:hypothetical protein
MCHKTKRNFPHCGMVCRLLSAHPHGFCKSSLGPERCGHACDLALVSGQQHLHNRLLYGIAYPDNTNLNWNMHSPPAPAVQPAIIWYYS